jgi:hypothetical protein
MRQIIAITAWALAACASQKPAEPVAATEEPPAADAARGAKSPQRSAKPSGAAMTSDFKPSAAFRAHAAKVLQVPVGEVEGGAIDAATAASLPHSNGAAWASTMWHNDDHSREVRGWVTADGTVVTPEQNLGILFAEVGVWAKSSKLSPDDLADKLAADLAWAYGMNNAVVITLDHGMAPPTLTLAGNGSGTFRFFLQWQRPGPGGAGGGPPSHFEINVVLTADHKAKLIKKPFQPTP